MKKFIVLAIASALMFAGCGSESKPSTPTPDAAQAPQDMTQFNADLGAYITAEANTMDKRVTISANCDPLNTGRTTCQLTFTGIGNDVDHQTIENVRRTDANFDWDQKSF